MALHVEKTRKELVSALRSAAPARPDPKAQSYLGSPVPVLGVRIPRLRAIVSAFRRAHRDLAVGDLNRLASSLWAGPTFEEKALAISLLDAFGRSLDAESWRLLDAWAGESSGWGLCDSLALGPITKIVHSHPRRFREVVRWTKSENRWRRRIAVYAMRDFVFAGELDQPFDVFERLLYDDEVWVQRAVGTWLRESWKKDRERTAAFLRAHARGLPPVTITVATERAPKAFREKLRRDARAATRTARRDRRDLPSWSWERPLKTEIVPRSLEASEGQPLSESSAEETLETQIRAARKLSLDGARATYDLTRGIDFSRPRRTAEAIARVVWDEDVKSWWSWRGGDPVFAPSRKVEIRLPADHHWKVARAAKDFQEELKKEELAPFLDSYLYGLKDDRADWFSIFFWGPLVAYLLQHAENRQRQRDALDHFFADMARYIVVSAP